MIELRVRGIAIRLSLLFPAAVVLLLTLDKSGIPAWCVAASLLHEGGHFAAMMLFGCKPSAIRMGIFGVRVEQNPAAPVSYGQNIVISLAGPMVNLLCFGAAYAAGGACIPAMVHLVLALFNLLPVEPLDGGQALFCLLAMHMEAERAERLVFLVSFAAVVPLAGVGFTLLLRSGYNFTLLLVSVYLGLLLLFKRK